MNDLDKDFSGIRGHYEPHSALIDFCEPNYVYSPYVAELWNSLSAVAMFFIGLYTYCCCLPESAKRTWNTRIIWGLFCLQSIGSVGLHAFLDRRFQKLDELPMVFCALACLYPLVADFSATDRNLNPDSSKTSALEHNRLLRWICVAGVVLFVIYEYFEYFEAFHALFTPIEFYSLGRMGYLCYHGDAALNTDHSAAAECDSKPCSSGTSLESVSARPTTPCTPASAAKKNSAVVGTKGQDEMKTGPARRTPTPQLRDFRKVGIAGLVVYGAAISVWVSEMLACKHVRPFQTHSWAWHLGAACGFQLLGLGMELRKNPRLRRIRHAGWLGIPVLYEIEATTGEGKKEK
eukprot:g1876.t1